MKNNRLNISKIAAAFTLCVFYPVSILNAEISGSITGIVVDLETKSPLESVNVILEGTGSGAATLVDGTFSFSDIPAGKYSLTASMIGYEKGYNLDVFVEPGKSTNIEFLLKESFFQMNQVVVTATRTNRIYANVPISTEVITQQDIIESGARDLSELLEDRAGVLPEPGVAGGKHINLLGSDSKYVLILIDGEPITGKFNDRVELDDIVTSTIERVEIVKGPASSLYGSEAMSGVINVITRNANSEFEINAKTRYSSNNGKEFGINIGSKKNELSYLIHGNIYQSGTDKNDPFLQIDNFSKKSLSGKLKYEFNPLNKISLKSEMIRNNEEGNLQSLKSRTDISRRNTELKYEMPYRDWANFELKLRTSSYEREFSKINSKNGDVLSSNVTTQNYKEVEANYIREANEKFKFNFGYEYSSDELLTPRLAGSESYTLNHQHVYAQSESQISNLFNFTGGIRYDVNTDVDDYTSPRAGVMLTFSDKFKLRAAWGRGFRLPSLINKFIDFPNVEYNYSVIGNPDLKPERSNGINIGLEYYLFRKSLITFNYFQNDFSDMITDTTLSPGIFSYVNIESTTLRGFETQAKVFISVMLTVQLAYNYLDAINNSNGNYLPNRARHSGSVKTTFRTASGKSRATIRATFVGSRNQRIYDIEEGSFLEEIGKANPYFIIDLDLNKKITRHFTLTGGINNILDTLDPLYGPWVGRKSYLGLETAW